MAKFIKAYDSKKRRLSPILGESLTQQHYKDECDINLIMKTFTSTGELPSNIRPAGVYADVSSVPEFFDGQQKLAEYRNYFSCLPSKLRDEYGNDYMNMLSDSPEHLAELGLFDIEKVVEDDPSNVLLDNTLLDDTKLKKSHKEGDTNGS